MSITRRTFGFLAAAAATALSLPAAAMPKPARIKLYPHQEKAFELIATMDGREYRLPAKYLGRTGLHGVSSTRSYGTHIPVGGRLTRLRLVHGDDVCIDYSLYGGCDLGPGDVTLRQHVYPDHSIGEGWEYLSKDYHRFIASH